jgi:hypothetical protein
MTPLTAAIQVRCSLQTRAACATKAWSRATSAACRAAKTRQRRQMVACARTASRGSARSPRASRSRAAKATPVATRHRVRRARTATARRQPVVVVIAPVPDAAAPPIARAAMPATLRQRLPSASGLPSALARRARTRPTAQAQKPRTATLLSVTPAGSKAARRHQTTALRARSAVTCRASACRGPSVWPRGCAHERPFVPAGRRRKAANDERVPRIGTGRSRLASECSSAGA